MMVGYVLWGQVLLCIYFGGCDILVCVCYEECDCESFVQFGNFLVLNDFGEVLVLSLFVDVEQLLLVIMIFCCDKQILCCMMFEFEFGKEEEVCKVIYVFVGGFDFFEGVSFGLCKVVINSGEVQSFVFVVLMFIVFVYLLMGFLFESFLLLMVILVMILLVNIGVIWIYVFIGCDMDFLGIVGQIILIGVVVNNGIVLFDYVNCFCDCGMECYEVLMFVFE